MASQILSRKLSYFESSLHYATISSISNTIYCWAKGSGAIEFQHVQTAMRVLYDRHPLLRARIMGEPGNYEFATDVSFEQIPVKEIQFSASENVNSVIEPLMNTPLPTDERTWGARFVRRTQSDDWWLILETDHAITDGHSAFCLLNQCGQLLGDLLAGNNISTSPLGMPDPIEDQLDPPGTMERWNHTGEAWAKRIGDISHWPTDGSADFSDRQNCNTFTVHNADFTRQLKNNCHAHGTTVQGALASAVARAIAAFLKHAINIDTLTPVNLRRFANVEIDPREIACKISCLDTGSFNVTIDSDPWEVACAYTSALKEQLDANHYPPVDFTAEDVTKSINGLLDADGYHTHGFSITNTGLLPFDGDYGPVQFETFDITAAAQFGGFPVLLSVYTFRHQLRCTYTWTQPLLTGEHVRMLTEAMESNLLAMAD
ncbi:MAG: hypothetical protein P8J86_12810 [Phycisphaerales bacterium]|nr:hypothetical protein [Phycisphaerales bacterium]